MAVQQNGTAKDTDDFTPRAYQIALLNIAIEDNTIIYLPTGSGKTYIALMLLKHFSNDLDIPLDKGGKRSVFLVNTIPLVAQQAKCIRRLTHVTEVGEFSGDMNVDIWSPTKWDIQINKYKALVMTCQIFLDIIRHGYLKLEQVNLIILDECHHATKDHPMHQLMEVYATSPCGLKPRILGLTATLLNSNCNPDNVMQDVRQLESALNSKVATVEELAEVIGYSTNPKETIAYFNHPIKTAIIESAYEDINTCINILDDLEVEDKNKLVLDIEENLEEFEDINSRKLRLMKRSKKNIKNTLCNMLKDCSYQIEMLGIYGGSIACLCHLIEIQIMQRRMDNDQMHDLCTFVITSLTVIQRKLKNYINEHKVSNFIYELSTPKVQELFYVLKKFAPDENDPNHAKMMGVVFVQRRFTAKVLYNVLKVLIQTDDTYKFLKPNFLIGMSSRALITQSLETVQSQLENKWTKRALLEFRTGKSNLLVATNLLEEGIDVPQCSLVIRFDEVGNYCTYVQSKGRARNATSNFCMLAPTNDMSKVMKNYNKYRKIERRLQEFLIGQNRQRTMPSEEEIKLELQEVVEPYIINSEARATLTSAVGLVNRYVSCLPHDKYTSLTINFYVETKMEAPDTKMYKVLLQMPSLSSVKLLVEGDWMLCTKNAKRSAALKACEILHKRGELNDNLMPIGKFVDISTLIKDFSNHWSDRESACEDTEDDCLSKTGTNSRKRTYSKTIPDILLNTSPVADMDAFLHLITIKPSFPEPTKSSNRLLQFYNILNNNKNFAIVSSKSLPKLCNFSLYFSAGEVEVCIENNSSKVKLSRYKLKKLKVFHKMLFKDLLAIGGVWDSISEACENDIGFLIAPADRSGIDWDTVNRFKEFKVPQKPNVQKRSKFEVDRELYTDAILIPWYRSVQKNLVYIVTRVCDELTPDSTFQTNNESVKYSDYYHDKYGLHVSAKDQPLLEVMHFSTQRLNYLKPRVSKSLKKRSATDDTSDEILNEHLIAEFCLRIDFPGVLFVKASLIPSVLHRLTVLIKSFDLIEIISKDLSLKNISTEDVIHEPYKIQKRTHEKEAIQWDNENIIRRILEGSSNEFSLTEAPLTTLPETYQNNLNKFTGNFEYALKKLDEQYPWKSVDEPKDIYRILHTFSLSEYLEYVKFVTNEQNFEFSTDTSVEPMSVDNDTVLTQKLTEIITEYQVRKIKMLGSKDNNSVVQIHEMTSVLTAQSANDIVNLERLEALGDSFLKFSITVYLMFKFPHLNEGQLTFVKCIIIGNKNLFFCGRLKRIGSIMNVEEFQPRVGFMPPGFYVDTGLSTPMDCNEIESEDLSLGSETKNLIKRLKCQIVSDKTVADGIEALIGQYLKTYDICKVLALLGWLHVVPPSVEISDLMKQAPIPAKLNPDITSDQIDFHIKGWRDLETKLGYSFKDRSYLLQALCHPSYATNRYTNCYQNLEFMGDAILDFLITCYIYENCGELTPGQLTDLRSALVNNITFACFTVRCGFHRCILAFSPDLTDAIDEFVISQENRNHKINDEILFLLEENETQVASFVDVPKVLGDIFESLAAAIFLDCGMDLDKVWEVFYKIMNKEIKMFSENVPKQAVRLLYESNACPIFGKVEDLEDTNFKMMPLEFTFRNKLRKVVGIGKNKTQAMKAAAKLAVRIMCSEIE